ncbi:hypothetical protein TNCV_4193141 [Trichonephila clavipes]|nr:hypothetical protein TNCV_4193141 [Trichonephila clavipes]
MKNMIENWVANIERLRSTVIQSIKNVTIQTTERKSRVIAPPSLPVLVESMTRNSNVPGRFATRNVLWQWSDNLRET